MPPKQRLPITSLSNLQFPHAAQRFADEVNAGGSSVHPVTRQFLEAGQPGYMVGGSRDVHSGERVPEVSHNGPITPVQAAAHMVRTAIASGGSQSVYAGGWHEKGNSVLDASDRFEDKAAADREAIHRGEREVYDAGSGTAYDPRKSRVK